MNQIRHPAPSLLAPVLALVLGAAILGGCATPFGGNTAPAAVPAALTEGIALYNGGDFNAAIARLGAPEMASAARASQISAHKYMAFSYCVTERHKLCRQQFAHAFKLDPAFDLGPGEHGHPLWGPMFTLARKTR